MKHKSIFLGSVIMLALILGACAPDATEVPTEAPVEPTEEVIVDPTGVPTEEPTEVPTDIPTEVPTEEPTPEPTEIYVPADQTVWPAGHPSESREAQNNLLITANP